MVVFNACVAIVVLLTLAGFAVGLARAKSAGERTPVVVAFVVQLVVVVAFFVLVVGMRKTGAVSAALALACALLPTCAYLLACQCCERRQRTAASFVPGASGNVAKGGDAMSDAVASRMAAGPDLQEPPVPMYNPSAVGTTQPLPQAAVQGGGGRSQVPAHAVPTVGGAGQGQWVAAEGASGQSLSHAQAMRDAARLVEQRRQAAPTSSSGSRGATAGGFTDGRGAAAGHPGANAGVWGTGGAVGPAAASRGASDGHAVSGMAIPAERGGAGLGSRSSSPQGSSTRARQPAVRDGAGAGLEARAFASGTAATKQAAVRGAGREGMQGMSQDVAQDASSQEEVAELAIRKLAETFADRKAKAESFRSKGKYLIAAGLFAKAAEVAPDKSKRRQMLFDQLGCYVKAGKADEARTLAQALRRESTLTRAERIKLNAVIAQS